MKTRITLPIVIILLAGIVAAFLMLRTQNTSMEKDHQENPDSEGKEVVDVVKGPRGGRLLSKDGFQVEITIYEKGIPPQFRIYAYEKGKPIDPNEVKLNIALHRLGGRVDEIQFQKKGEYLHGDKIVEEPHSFDVKVAAEWKGESYQWEYAQVEGRIEMSPEAAKAAGIEIQTAGTVQMKTVLELPGEIGLNKNKVAHVVPRLSGVVTEVRKNLGDRVKRGEVIAVIDSRELAEVKTEYIESVHRLEFSQATFVREESLWRKKITPEQDYLMARHGLEEAEISRQSSEQKLLSLGLSREELAWRATEPEGKVIQHQIRTPFSERMLTRYELRAPQDGVVIEKRVSVGEAIKEDADIFIIADLSTVWGEITVYAKDLRGVEVGQKVTVRSKELGLAETGKISYLGPLIGGQTRAASAHVDIPNAKGLWRPGLFVTVELFQEEVPVPVAVLSDALQTFRDWDVVFVQYGDQFEARPLELGKSDGQWVEVVSGLSPGENYAVRNSFVLKADLGKSGASHDH